MTNKNLIFKSLKKENILSSDFEELIQNNIIDFSNKKQQNKMAVCYAPNGMGKTTISKILNEEIGTSYSVEYCLTEYKSGLFHIISDQSNRNIISGETGEFVLGDQIRHEKELESKIESECNSKYQLIKTKLNELGIVKKSDVLVENFIERDVKKFVEKLVNTQDRGKTIDKKEIIEYMRNLKEFEIEENEQFNYIVKELNKKESVLYKVLNVKSIVKQSTVRIIEEAEDALGILEKYSYKHECIVCDNKIDKSELKKKKEELKVKEKNKLDSELKSLIEKIINEIKGEDILQLKEILLSSIENGHIEKILELSILVNENIEKLNKKIKNILYQNKISDEIEANIGELEQLRTNSIEIDDESFNLIKELINENIEKSLVVERSEKEVKIKLDGKNIIGDSCSFELSTGEQNFLSLSFEILKAKNSDKKIILVDDPISSFDSIYKNKLVFIMVKIFFEIPQDIIFLTHNLELPRLMLHQIKNPYNFYLLSNVSDANDGFIAVDEKEVELIMYLDKLVNFFRQGVENEILSKKEFLISMIPFMRGISNILNLTEVKNKLNKVMHGYESEVIDLNSIYKELFGIELNNQEILINVSDILSLDLNRIKILKSETSFNLLDKTLRHSLVYLYLRLKVEKVLVDKYNIDTKKNDMLAQIIGKVPDIKKKIFLNSRKTLLNEFNHFEGNLSIFQPSIDITDIALEREKEQVLNFLQREIEEITV